MSAGCGMDGISPKFAIGFFLFFLVIGNIYIVRQLALEVTKVKVETEQQLTELYLRVQELERQ